MTNKPPSAEGIRLNWFDIPLHTRHIIELWLGSEIVNISSQTSGFSPGVSATFTLADARNVFIKAVGPKPNPGIASVHRHELNIVSQLPNDIPVPRLLWSYDDLETGWVTLIFENIDGWHPANPWKQDELRRAIDALVDLNGKLTPSPLLVRDASSAFAETVCGWQKLKNEQSIFNNQLDDWSVRHLNQLAEIEALAPNAVTGNTLLHFDVRADNMLFTSDCVWFFDWPHARIGAEWVDVVCFAPSVAMQGGLLPEKLCVQHPAFQRADPMFITAAVVSLAGFFTYQALQLPPPGLPTLRAFQDAQGQVARQWIVDRTDLD